MNWSGRPTWQFFTATEATTWQKTPITSASMPTCGPDYHHGYGTPIPGSRRPFPKRPRGPEYRRWPHPETSVGPLRWYLPGFDGGLSNGTASRGGHSAYWIGLIRNRQALSAPLFKVDKRLPRRSLRFPPVVREPELTRRSSIAALLTSVLKPPAALALMTRRRRRRLLPARGHGGRGSGPGPWGAWRGCGSVCSSWNALHSPVGKVRRCCEVRIWQSHVLLH